jgi:hypothetical protein
MIVEVNDAGEILIPAELVQAAPHTFLVADREGESVVLTPLTGDRHAGAATSSIRSRLFKAGLSNPR